jgi:hypothetical protein
MHSYFVWLSMPDGSLIHLNVASGMTPDQVNTWLREFFKVVDKRLEQLKRPERVKDAFRFRINLDPAHLDSAEEAAHLGDGWKLSGSYPGRFKYPLTI